MAKHKRYVVRQGKETGIFNTREECKSAVHGVAGAQYKSYESLILAKQAYSGAYRDAITTSPTTKKTSLTTLIANGTIVANSICVDAACSSNPGKLEWRGVDMSSSQEIFHSPLYPLGTTNIGERLAIIQGIRRLEQYDRVDNIIYSDSRIALGRIRQQTIRTTLPRDHNTAGLWTQIDNALTRLEECDISRFRLLKWHTREWGEIPADFGRK